VWSAAAWARRDAGEARKAAAAPAGASAEERPAGLTAARAEALEDAEELKQRARIAVRALEEALLTATAATATTAAPEPSGEAAREDALKRSLAALRLKARVQRGAALLPNARRASEWPRVPRVASAPCVACVRPAPRVRPSPTVARRPARVIRVFARLFVARVPRLVAVARARAAVGEEGVSVGHVEVGVERAAAPARDRQKSE
jgi:hypothetical protein